MTWPNQTIEDTIEKCLPSADIFLLSWNLNPLREGWSLRIVAEADDGITLKQLAAINRGLRDDFSLEGLDPEEVSIEVTSPGVSRPVTMLRHFRRYMGHTLHLTHEVATLPDPFEGKLTAIENIDGKDCLLFDSEGGQAIIPFVAIFEGQVKLPW